jgi:hypothetical protein
MKIIKGIEGGEKMRSLKSFSAEEKQQILNDKRENPFKRY